MNNIFTICYSEEEANEIGHFIMSKGYEGVQNDSYRYCRESIRWALKQSKRHHLSYIYVGVMGCQMCVSRNKRGLRRKGLKYIEKKRMFYELLEFTEYLAQSDSTPIFLALGILLPTVFIIMSKAVEFAGIVRSDAAQRLSLFLPIVASFIIFHETLSQKLLALFWHSLVYSVS